MKLTGRLGASQVNFSFSLNADRSAELKGSVGLLLSLPELFNVRRV